MPFKAVLRELEGPPKRPIGATTEAVFRDDDLPDEREAALDDLRRVKRNVLAGDADGADENAEDSAK